MPAWTTNLGGFDTGGMRLLARPEGHSVLVRRAPDGLYTSGDPWEWCVVGWTEGFGWPRLWGSAASQPDALAAGFRCLAKDFSGTS
jgi:hypothetical protein